MPKGYRISEKGKKYIKDELENDPKYREEYEKIKEKMEKVLPRLLKMSKKELFDEIYNGLGDE